MRVAGLAECSRLLVEGSFTRALGQSLDEAGILLFREGSARRWFGWAFFAWVSTLGAVAIELPLAVLAAGDWIGRFRDAILAKSWLLVPCGGLLVLGAVALAWLRACGLMVFLDFLVRGEGGVGVAWGRQRGNVNRLFLVWVALGSAAMLFAGGLAAGWFWWFRGRALSWGMLGADDAMVFGAFCAVGAIGAVGLSALGVLVEDFVCAAMLGGAARGTWGEIRRGLAWLAARGDSVLAYLGFRVCLALAVASVALTVGCLSCGAAFLPYLGTLLLLPLHAFWRLFPLLFLRENGVDAWAGGAPPRVTIFAPAAKPPLLVLATSPRVPPRLGKKELSV